MSTRPQTIEEFIEQSFEQNYELLRLEGGVLAPLAKEAAKQQVLLYWQKLQHIARAVTETEVKLTLPNQETPEGRPFTVEGVVDIVKEAGRTTMYDIKTHTVDDVCAKIGDYEQQLNVYAHIWHKLRGKPLEGTAIIATRLPSSLRAALASGSDGYIADEFEKWNPVIPIPFDPSRVDATIEAFGTVVDAIEGGNFEARPVDVLRARHGNSRQFFATLVCAECDARFSCISYREYAGASRGRAEAAFAQLYASALSDVSREEWRSASLDDREVEFQKPRMSCERLRPPTALDDERLDALRRLLPEAFADGRIDWDSLKDLLGAQLEYPSEESFGLSWPGKREARRFAARPTESTVAPLPGAGVSEDSTHHVFIEGENLEVLKFLRNTYTNRIKLIFIDPPYNTGNDFIYSDDFVEPADAYLRRTGQADEQGLMTTNPRSSGRYHSNWLNMIYPRLLLAKHLLRPDGVIFITLDDNEIHNLRSVLDEIFGPENFVNTVIWQKLYSPKSSARHFSEDHDYVVIYARDAEIWQPTLLPRTPEMDARYANPDNDPRGRWKPGGLDARNYYSKGTYPITCPSGRVVPGPPAGSYWRVSLEKFNELDQDSRIWWGEKGDGVPAIKQFLTKVKQGRVPQTLWTYQDVGHTQEAKQQLLQAVTFGETDNVLDSVKPPRLIERILHLATTPSDGDIVLDFFAGSGTTAHAVYNKNAQDGGNRRFVLVQVPEPLPKPEPYLRTIADIATTRIRSVGASIAAGKYQGKGAEVDLSTLDLGFRSYRSRPSHFKRWDPEAHGDLPSLLTGLEQAITSLVGGWQPEDLLVEVMVWQGFPLDSKITRQPQVTGNDVRKVTSDFQDFALWVCLDGSLSESALSGLHLGPDDVFVCLDQALTDGAKLRLSNVCKLRATRRSLRS